MNITRSEVDRIAALARLQFSEEESRRLAAEMTRILEYMSVLDEVDTAGVPATAMDTQGIPMDNPATAMDSDEKNRLRNDIAMPVDGRSLLEQAASRDGDHLSVPGVFLSVPGVFPSVPGVFRKRKQ